MAPLTDLKDQARKAAFARRKLAFDAGQGTAAHLDAVLANHRGKPIAGYMAMRTEIDPTDAMAAAAVHGPVGVPVINAPHQPLRFREWTPGCTMIPGTFGAQIPQSGDWITPQVVIVPLVAFDLAGGRLGYGGGFYDRTLERLRAARPTLAIGFAYGTQQADDLPLEPTDQLLDMIVTETGIVFP